MKREILNFSNKISQKLSKPDKKFTADMLYGMCMAFPAHISMKSESNGLKAAIMQKADLVKEKVCFHYYRLAKGISGILSYAKEGVRLWFRTKRPAYRQLSLKLVI